MTRLLAAAAALFTTPVLAHPGHTEIVAGHSHSLVGLAIMGTVAALLVVAGLVFFGLRANRHND